LEILLVEDNEAHVELIRRALMSERKKFHLTVAGTLAEARKMLKKVQPGLMIVDYKLPDGEGIELLPGDPGKLTFPVVMLTGHGDEKVAAAAIRAGALDYIAKSDRTLADIPHIIERILREWEHITERRQAEKALQQEEQRARQIIATARDAFVSMDADGIITDWNPRAEEIFGWSRSEALGQKPTELFVPEEYHEAHIKGFAHYLATGEGPMINQHIEITALHRDGHTLPVELSIVPVRSDDSVSFNAFIRDISARQRAQKALEKSRGQLKAGLIGTIVAVSRAVEARDPYTAGHQQRVARLARCIAQEMELDAEQIEGLRMGATIHDIGKIHLPAEILSKPSKLTEMEFELVKTHSQVGYDILKDIKFPWPVADIAYQHHERIDGTGYPQGLKGDEICLEARIVAVADVVEAMSSHRPYRPALGIDAALKEIESHRGQWFEPAAVDACLKLFREKKFSFG